jgi:redox-regulated HSP33 family molecular chaperone
MGKSKKNKTSEEGSNLEQLVHEALLRNGWVIPQTVEEVIRVQDEFPEKSEQLPNALKDPYTVLKRSTERAKSVSALSLPDQESQDVMARAARLGGEISSEIEERMKRDRQAAEEEDKANDRKDP